MKPVNGSKKLADDSQATAPAFTPHTATPETVETVHGVRVETSRLANWEKWSRVPVVNLLQAVHLSFGVEPSPDFLGCTPTAPLAQRLDLALANIGLGGSLEIVGDPFFPYSSWLKIRATTVRVRLPSFGDWVLKNDLKLDWNCPRSTPGLPAPPDQALKRQQQTLLKVVGMLARTVAKGKRSGMRDDKVIVNVVVNAALEACESQDGPLGAKKSTLAAYIRRGLNLLDEKY